MVSLTERELKLREAAVHLVSEAMAIPVEAIMSRRRFAPQVEARAVCMYLLTRIAGITLKKVGAMFGHKDHTTVIHGRNFIETCIQLNGYGRPYEPEIARLINIVQPAFIDRMGAIDGEAYYEWPKHNQTAGYI
jgi:chromosomal replication initiator protein